MIVGNAFLQIINMSFTASFVILFVICIRMLLKKAPKIFSYILWIAPLFRLICPLSFKSVLSLIPINTKPVTPNIFYETIPQIDTGIHFINNSVNQIFPKATPYASINPMQMLQLVGEMVWIFGICVMIIYSISSLIRLRYQLIGAVKLHSNIYLADHIISPFVIGIFRPKIFLPSTLLKQEQDYIILHEQTHIRRFDHNIKIIAFLVLTIHWFNPLVWLAFVLFTKDVEMSCDESVMKHMNSDIRIEYSTSLLNLATGRKIIVGAPLAFGEGNTKARIKNVLKYKKPTLWVLILSVVIVIAVCFGLIANPKEMVEPKKNIYLSNLRQYNSRNRRYHIGLLW